MKTINKICDIMKPMPTTILELIEMYPELTNKLMFDLFNCPVNKLEDSLTPQSAIKNYKKSLQRKPLFKDYLGNDMYDDDLLFEVAKDFSIHGITNNGANYKEHYPTEKYFKHKSDAEYYVMLNDPVLSYNDLLNLNHGSSDIIVIEKEKLLELIKHKLAK